MLPWLRFLPQSCCDAQDYLALGSRCAQGACYDPLRPMGGSLWFSLPYRLGLPPESLILAHLILLLVSSVLLSLVVFRLSARSLSQSRFSRKWMRGAFFLAILALITFAQWVLFRPVMFNSLTDAPAGLFILIAISLLLLHKGRRSWLSLGIAGALLGLAVWMRAMYLYPVVIVVAVFLVLWVKNRSRRLGELTFIAALIPILLQFGATYHVYGDVSFIAREWTAWNLRAHVGSAVMGVDSLLPNSVLPGRFYVWPSSCGVENGLLGAWERKDVAGAICLIADKVRFYLGSYSPRAYTYIGDETQQGDIPKDKIRVWSNGLLALNALATVGAAWFFVRKRRILGVGGFITMLLSALIFGQGLLTLPEQRFVVVFHVVTWVAFLTSILVLLAESRAIKAMSKRWFAGH